MIENLTVEVVDTENRQCERPVLVNRNDFGSVVRGIGEYVINEYLHYAKIRFASGWVRLEGAARVFVFDVSFPKRLFQISVNIKHTK